MAMIEVMARANLTLRGDIRLEPGVVISLEDNDETRACITQQLIVVRDESGAFPDLGPVGAPAYYPPGISCCGK